MQEVTDSLDLYSRIAGLLDKKVNPLEGKIDTLTSKVETLTTQHALNAAQTATHEARIQVLEKFKSELPDKQTQSILNKATLNWQTIAGYLGIGTFILYALQHVRLIW